MAGKLLSVEFAKQGLESAYSLVPGLGAAAAAAVAGAATRAFSDSNRERALIGYSTPILRRLASQAGEPFEERELFKQVASDVRTPDFQDFRLALAGLTDQRLVETAGQNEFGDWRYKITEGGLSVTPG
jgi:hypothetical protein